MPTGYKFTYNNEIVDLSDVYMEKQYFPNNPAGYLWSWGGNSYYSGGAGSLGLGVNNFNNRSSPVQNIMGATNWKQVSSNYGVISEIRFDGTLWSAGRADNGQLGNNRTSSGFPNFCSPVQIVSGGIDWKQVSCGGVTNGAIKTDGTLWLWGANYAGQLGDNTAIDKSSPVQIITGGSWKILSAGTNNCSAIKDDGTLWLWGSAYLGQLGDNTDISKSSPVQIITGGRWSKISSTANSKAAIKTDGTLWLWGSNASGQLGDNTTIDKSSPVQIITGGTWRDVSISSSSAAGIKTDGTLWTWGFNNSGQLGDNTTIDKSSPVQTIAGGNVWKQVSSGFRHKAAIKTDGTLWLWGSGGYGQLGDNNTTSRSSPIQTVMRVNNWGQVSCGFINTSAIQDVG